MKINNININYLYSVFVLTWILINFILITKGIYYTGSDTSRYINDGREIFNGEILTGRSILYYGYNIFLGFLDFLNFSFKEIAIIQIIINFIASVCLIGICEKIWEAGTGKLLSIIFLFYYPLQIWNFYIYTESLFVSLFVISTYFFFCRRNYSSKVIGFILFCVTSSIKPHGFLVILSLILLFVIKNFKKKIKLFLYISILLFFLFSIFKLFSYVTKVHNEPVKTYETGAIISDFNKHDLIVSPPNSEDYILKIKDKNLMQQSIVTFLNEPIYFSKLFLSKSFFYFVRARPYYDPLNNLLLILSSIIFLIGFFLSFRNIRNIDLYLFLNLILFLNLFFVSITYVEWNGRFSLISIPIFIIFMSNLLIKIKKLIN